MISLVLPLGGDAFLFHTFLKKEKEEEKEYA